MQSASDEAPVPGPLVFARKRMHNTCSLEAGSLGSVLNGVSRSLIFGNEESESMYVCMYNTCALLAASTYVRR